MIAPPRLARAVLERCLAPHLRDAVVGDLAELFTDDAADAPWRARARYWRRAAAALWHLSARPTRPLHPASGDAVMTTLVKDLALGLRLFARQPAYAWAAVFTLALAIGANTVIFSLANVLVLKPLPLREPAGLGWVLATGPQTIHDRAGTSLPEYAAYRDGAPAFARLAAWRRRPATLRVDGASERIVSQAVIGDLHGLWGLTAVRGRVLASDDEHAGAAPVAVLSHRFWITRFGAAADAVGRVLVIDGRPSTVVGVLAPDIELGNLSEIDLWLPTTANPAAGDRTDRGWRPVGRLAEGATVSIADAQVAAIAARLAREFPATNRDWTARVGTTREALGGANVWLVLALLSTVVALLLVLACANIMNLLIARLIGRRQELAVRAALGATRGRLVRQIVSESLVLGLAGGFAGVMVAAAGLAGIHAIATEPFFKQVALDGRVVGFAFALAVVAPLVFAVLPALRLLRGDVRAGLHDGTTRSVGGVAAARGRATLVVLQVSLAVTLLVVSSLAIQSMRAVTRADLGYDPRGLLSAAIDVPAWKTADEAEAQRLRHDLVARVQTLPGVQAVALTTTLPGVQFPVTTPFDIAGRPARDARDRPSAGLTITSPDYFAATGVPLVAGRAFTAADAAAPAPVAIVSREAARRYWSRPDLALGATIVVPPAAGAAPVTATVVGVAADLTNPDLNPLPAPALYLLDEHRPARATYILVRADAPAALAEPLRQTMRQLDADLPLFQVRTLVEAIADDNSSNVLLGALFGAFAGVAVLLAAAGLYGVLSYLVSQRTPEIAVRLALGASARSVAATVIGRSLRLAVIGIGLGLAGAFGLARTMTSLLYGVTATDPATYAGAAALALAAALLASWLPMRRAALVDPIRSLRGA